VKISGSSSRTAPLTFVRYHKRRATCVSVSADSVSQHSTNRHRRGAGSSAAAAAPSKQQHDAPTTAAAASAYTVAPEADAAPPAAAPAPPGGNGKPGGKQQAAAPLSVGTAAVHGGELAYRSRARQGIADALTTPIVQTSTYTFRNTAELIAFQEGNFKSFEYGRYGNPTARAAEEKLMALEGAEDALLSASGMCSATTMLLALVPAGGHVVTTTDCYRRTRQFIQTMLPKMGAAAGAGAA